MGQIHINYYIYYDIARLLMRFFFLSHIPDLYMAIFYVSSDIFPPYLMALFFSLTLSRLSPKLHNYFIVTHYFFSLH